MSSREIVILGLIGGCLAFGGCSGATSGAGTSALADTPPPAVTGPSADAGPLDGCDGADCNVDDASPGCAEGSTRRGTECVADALEERVAAGRDFTCGVKSDGTLACWGDPTSGKTNPPKGQFRQISANEDQACAVKADDGSVVCWGSAGLTAESGAFRQISVGGYGSMPFACGVKFDDAIACWGKKEFDGSTTKAAVPPAGAFQQVSAGAEHACGLGTDGSVICWGKWGWATGGAVPAGTFQQITSGPGHTCGLRPDGTVECWTDVPGQRNERSTPPFGTFRQVDAGHHMSCGLKTDGAVACWGEPYYNHAPPSGSYRQVSSGFAHSCAVKSTGDVVCWGVDQIGETKPPAATFW